ncbi:MAG: hypothetical protein ACREVR_06285 [Burkholderiales bacterium]
MKKLGWGFVCALAAAPIVCGPSSVAVAQEPKVIATKPQKVGNGWARTYVALNANGKALALGVSLDKAALEGLPKEPNATSRCFDKNGNGKMDEHECIGDFNFTFVIPEGEAAKTVAPFRWVSLNWNPHGHIPPAPPPWAVPHFDFHFYIQDRESVRAIRPGACGELIDCEDFKKATKAVPAKYLHRDHINVDAAVPDMGNHMINSKAPELAPKGPPFTHTFIFGAYDGKVTFLEPMITHAYLASNPSMCAPVKQPEAWEVAGAYPTMYCIRHLERVGRYTISLEGFVEHPAR